MSLLRRQRPLAAFMAVAALLLAQALGLAHRVAHAPHAPDAHDGTSATAFDAHHDEGSPECRLVDQAAFGDAVTTPVVVAGLPPAGTVSVLGALSVAVARLHAQPYCARGPPRFLA